MAQGQTTAKQQASAPVEIPAHVIVWSALLLRCIFGDREVDLSPQLLLPGTTVERNGDQGIVVLPAWYATTLGLA